MNLHSCATLLGAAGLSLFVAGAAFAQPHHEAGHGGGARAYPVHPYTAHDRDVWRGGGWQHGLHNGRLGWWWVVGPEWYYYPAPIYPFPNPYLPPWISVPQPNMWYWCDAPAGYYPYVAQCSVPWRAVAPRPAG